ncbi:RHS repeat-associated core domain-containing protein, partial [Citrobacter amalonaticus]
LQETVWYAWDGNRLTTTQTDETRIQTVYLPGSFTPLIRIETATGELTRATRRTLAEKFQQEANVTFPPELVAMVDNLEAELRRGELSEANQQWLALCGLTPEQMKNQLEPEYTPERKIHLYHCDHRGLPLALIDVNGAIAWRAEFDEWGNVLREDNPHNLEQLIRLPGQQWDKETGLYYNRHRYYDSAQGRYITQDPIGLAGGRNLYQYPLNPVTKIDPLGLFQMCHRDLLLPIPYARHCYVKFDDGSTSSYDPKGVNPDPDPHQEGTVCTEPKQPALDDCIKKAMDQCKGKDYSFTEFNCCHCAEQAMKECGTSIPKGAWPNSPVNPGPQPGENGFTPDPVYNSTLGK